MNINLKFLEAIKNPHVDYRYSYNQNEFLGIPETPIAYWITPKGLQAFNEGILLKEFANLDTVQKVKKQLDEQKEIVKTDLNSIKKQLEEKEKEALITHQGGDLRCSLFDGPKCPCP